MDFGGNQEVPMIVVHVGELAKQLGVHRNTVRNWIRDGKLPARAAPGKRYFVEDVDLQKLCQEFGLDHSSLALKQLPTGQAPMRKVIMSEAKTRSIELRPDRLKPQLQVISQCLTCGSCASGCPVSGVDGMDPRKAIRMSVLGLEQELIDSQWPWKCTLCGKCEEACPMNVEIVATLRRVRGLRDRDKVPGPLHKGVLMCLDKGNNLGIPQEDFVDLCQELGEELAEEGCPGFTTPVDVEGANVLVTVNSKEPFAEPEDMKFWWKIFYAAKESWTIPSQNWEGVNWGLFTGDDESMKTVVGRIVENMYRLNCKTLLLPE
jgi:excisionase family DNA binding protein